MTTPSLKKELEETALFTVTVATAGTKLRGPAIHFDGKSPFLPGDCDPVEVFEGCDGRYTAMWHSQAPVDSKYKSHHPSRGN